MRAPAAAAGLLALAACSGAPEGAADGEQSAESRPPFPSSSPSSRQSGPQVVAHYTALDVEQCEEIERATEGEFVVWRCSGFDGIPYWVKLGDGRYDIDVGTEGTGGYSTLGAFNDLGKTLEWRARSDAPFAVIFRYRDAVPETPDRTVLAVEKIGGGGKPGCRVAHVAGDTPDANARARELADARAAGFRCDVDEPIFVGDSR